MPLDEIRKKLEKGQEKLSQDETSALVDQYMIDSFEASQKKGSGSCTCCHGASCPTHDNDRR